MLLFFSSGSYPGTYTGYFFFRLISILFTVTVSVIVARSVRLCGQKASTYILGPPSSPSSTQKKKNAKSVESFSDQRQATGPTAKKISNNIKQKSAMEDGLE